MRTTAELVIGLLPEWRFSRELNPDIGYAELQIRALASWIGQFCIPPSLALWS